jgi:glycogen(starch) synthase
VLYSGRFVDRKGIRELLDAAPGILADTSETEIVMVGGHRYAEPSSVAKYWLPEACNPWRDRIHFTGWLSSEDVDEWYAAADILVVPSWYEPFGMVVLEGMLFGLAIVASAVGGPREILTDGHTGILCEPKSATSLHREIVRLVKDPDLRHRLGRNAAREVRSRWLYRNVVERMRSVYRELAEADGVPHPGA